MILRLDQGVVVRDENFLAADDGCDRRTLRQGHIADAPSHPLRGLGIAVHENFAPLRLSSSADMMLSSSSLVSAQNTSIDSTFSCSSSSSSVASPHSTKVRCSFSANNVQVAL